MSLLPGDIVIVEHTPQNDPTIAKARPALVISSSSFNDSNIDVIILIVTSVVRHNSPTDHIIKIDDPCFLQTSSNTLIDSHLERDLVERKNRNDQRIRKG